MRVIPTDPFWEPAGEAAQGAARLLKRMVPDADSVDAEVHQEVWFHDPGANFEGVSCPACDRELSQAWWGDQMDRAHEPGQGYAGLVVETPCCGTATTLNDLTYSWPAGFSRACLTVLNPRRSWLTDQEVQRIEAVLGHAIRQVLAHY